MSRQSVELPEDTKEGLQEMAKVLGMTQQALISLATTTMVAKYREVGLRIFFDLITTEKKAK